MPELAVLGDAAGFHSPAPRLGQTERGGAAVAVRPDRQQCGIAVQRRSERRCPQSRDRRGRDAQLDTRQRCELGRVLPADRARHPRPFPPSRRRSRTRARDRRVRRRARHRHARRSAGVRALRVTKPRARQQRPRRRRRTARRRSRARRCPHRRRRARGRAAASAAVCTPASSSARSTKRLSQSGGPDATSTRSGVRRPHPRSRRCDRPSLRVEAPLVPAVARRPHVERAGCTTIRVEAQAHAVERACTVGQPHDHAVARSAEQLETDGHAALGDVSNSATTRAAPRAAARASRQGS
jgi:hypothetical protein